MERHDTKKAPGEEHGALRVWMLGGFRVSVGDRRIRENEWRLRKAASLVKLLSLAPGHHLHREQVMDRLWPDLSPKAAANNLHRALHVARRALEADPAASSCYLRLRDEELALCPSGRLRVDVEAFEEAAATARRVREPAAYRAAVDLYAGDLLPGDRYEEWAERRREELRRLHQALLVEMAWLYEQRGEYEPAIEALRRAVAEDPADEGTHADLMRLFAIRGRHREAVLQYEQLTNALSRELGTEPGAASRLLYEEIRAGKFLVAPPPSEGREEPVEPAPNNLPASLTSFVGREREMLEVKRMLPMTRLLTLTGAGGSGKTRLALEVARDILGVYPDGVWLVELAGLPDPVLVPSAVAQALGVRERPDLPLTATLVDFLGSKRMLLVLDNCEHLIDACARLVDTLLSSCKHLRVLATSREALGVAGETNWLVPSLTVPDAGHLPSVEDLTRYEAVRLFVERVRSRLPAFVLTPENARAVVEVCRRLDGIPLAIELATARVSALAVEQVAERLQDSLKLLTTGSRTAPARHQTLRATLDWSYELLSGQERKLFGRLSVFAGGWTLEAAEAVGAGASIEQGEVLDLLSRLVDKSLVVAEVGREGALRYRMLEPIRQYGQERLEANGEADTIRRRHADFFVRLAEEAEPELTGAGQRGWLDRLETELDNLRTALGWSLDGGEPEVGLRLAETLWWFCYLRGHYGEGREWLEEALAKSEDPPVPLRAKALTAAGVLAFLQCEYGLATAQLEEGLALCRELGDERGVASALQTLGSVAREQGHYARAQALHEESLSLWRELGNEWGVAHSLNYLGFAAWLREDHERATVLCAEALDLYRDLGDAEGIAWSLISLGAAAQYRGDLGQSETLLEESLTLSQEAGYREGIAWSLNELGIVAYRRDDLGRAGALLKESLRVHHDLGDRWRIASVLEGLAEAACAQREFERAARLLGAADALREAIGTPVPLCERTERDRNVAAARARLDDAAWEAAWAAGRVMSLGEAVGYALGTGGDLPAVSAAQGEPSVGRLPVVLTSREREVALLIARGLTNRRIASELTISERTVTTHVNHILGKLGATSRTQVAAWVVEQRVLPEEEKGSG